MEGFNIGLRDGLRDGNLSLYVTHRQTRAGLFALGIRALFGRLRQARDFEVHMTQALTVTNHRRRFLHVATDGEVALMETPLNYRIHALCLKVVVPKDAQP
jgi:diacylglycerol kinase family enzyme